MDPRLLFFALCCCVFTAACSSSPDRDDSLGLEDVEDEETVQLEDSDIIPVGESPTKGSDDAWVTVVVFADFQCPFCGRLAATLEEVMASFDDDTMRLVFKHYPLDAHSGARKAALAAEAAREQGKFWEMHDALFDDFARLATDEPRQAILQIAEEVGLDTDRLVEDMEHDRIAERVDGDLVLADELGLESVPAVFINGGFIPGAQRPETYQRTIFDVRQILEESVAREEIERREVYRSSVEMLHAETAPGEVDTQGGASPVREVPIDGDEPQTAKLEEAVVQIAFFLSLSDEHSLELQRQLNDIAHDDREVRIVYFHLPHAQDEATRFAHRALEGADSTEEVRQLLLWLSDEDQGWRSDISLLEKYVDEHGIEVVSEGEFDTILKSHIEAAQRYEIQGTPTTFVNGIGVLGVPEPPRLAALVEEQKALAVRIADIQGLKGLALYEAMVEGNRQRKGQF